MTKFRGFLLHLGISATVVGIALAVIYFVWYPEPYFRIIGTWNVVRVLIGVDLVLGPLLTLIFYKPGKPKIRLDLTIIALIQCTALVYGMVTIYKERPAYLVFAVDRLNVLSERDVGESELPSAVANDRRSGPRRAVALLPEDPVERSDLMFETIAGGADIEARPELWVGWDEGSAAVRERLQRVERLRSAGTEASRALDAIIERSGRNEGELAFLPVVTPRLDARSMILDRASLKVVGVVSVDPWTLPAESSPNTPGE